MKRLIVTLVMVAALPGCTKTPDGDVVAVVNGDEITSPELNAAVSQVPAGADIKLVRNAALERLINERLMVQSARASGLDKSRDYILKAQAADHLILASMFAKETTDHISQSHVNDVDDYIRSSPSRFSQRVVLTVDQLKVPQQAISEAWLKDAKSLDEIGQVLSAHNVPFDRGRAAIDSFSLETADYGKIAAVPAGRPFAVVENGTLIFTTVIGKQSAPIIGEDARRAATAMLQQKAAQDVVTRRVRALRSAAKIAYQPGFATAQGSAKAAPNI